MKDNILRSVFFIVVIFQVFRIIATLSGLPTDTTYDPATDTSYTSKESWQLGISIWALSLGCGFFYFQYRERRRKRNPSETSSPNSDHP